MGNWSPTMSDMRIEANGTWRMTTRFGGGQHSERLRLGSTKGRRSPMSATASSSIPTVVPESVAGFNPNQPARHSSSSTKADGGGVGNRQPHRHDSARNDGRGSGRPD